MKIYRINNKANKANKAKRARKAEYADKVTVCSDIYDFDDGSLRVSKGSTGDLKYKHNRDYWRIEFENGDTFAIYAPLLENSGKVGKVGKAKDLDVGEKVVATKDIYDMVGSDIFVKDGSSGIVDSVKGKDFIRVGFPSYRDSRPIGVHCSEIEKAG